MSFENKHVLVVGGAGFVGSNLVKKILSQYSSVTITVIDNLISSETENLPVDKRLNIIIGSVANDTVLGKIPTDINVVFHLACYHGNQSSIEDPIADHDNNSITTLKLLERIKSFSHLEKVVYAAAGCAVAEKTFEKATATIEDAPVSLFHDSPYSISKIIGELYGNYYFQRFNLPFVKARFQNVYGPNEVLGAGIWRGTRHTVWRNVTPTFIWKAMNKEVLPLDNGGVATRDFIYVDDMTNGLIACALKGVAGETYNLATGQETSIFELAQTINTLTNNSAGVTSAPPRDWDRSGKRFGHTEKALKQLGFQAQVSIEQGLKQTVEWTIENRARIRQCMHKHKHFVSEVINY